MTFQEWYKEGEPFTDETLAIREYLAKARGFQEFRDGEWCDNHGYYNCLPNPFTSASDLLALLEWARKQEWFLGMQLDMNGQLTIDLVVPGRFSQSTSEGSFQEALTLAIYRALQEVEQNGK